MTEQLINAYNRARAWVEKKLGTVAENYLVNLFTDSTLYDSVVMQIDHAGTPNAVLSSNELGLLQEMVGEKIVPNGKDVVYGGSRTRIYMPGTRADLPEDVLVAKFVQALGMATLCENTVSAFPRILDRVYRYDSITSELFANNVYELVLERNAAWAWQYFQDFVATLRLLARYRLTDFYVPPATMRETSVFYNFLLEIKEITIKRAEEERKAPLWELILHGFGTWILQEYLASIQDSDSLLPHLKGNLGQAYGELGAEFLRWRAEETGTGVYELAISLPNDYELVRHWKRGDTKERVELVAERLSNTAGAWHHYKEGYWSDLWPLRNIAIDRVADLVGKIQRKRFTKVVDLLEDKPTVISHGHIQMPDREVAVFSINEDTVGQEQLLLLRNHLTFKKGEFTTPLPGLPDVIVFRKFAGMHVASYIGVKPSFGYPLSPYDLPLVTRAVQVSKKSDAYKSVERDEEGKLDQTVDYTLLKGLTEPQRRAVQYLIRQMEVEQ